MLLIYLTIMTSLSMFLCCPVSNSVCYGLSVSVAFDVLLSQAIIITTMRCVMIRDLSGLQHHGNERPTDWNQKQWALDVVRVAEREGTLQLPQAGYMILISVFSNVRIRR
jgi:hypothetical protein